MDVIIVTIIIDNEVAVIDVVVVITDYYLHCNR